MSIADRKAAMKCLWPEVSAGEVEALGRIRGLRKAALLRWLDHAGLSLYLFRHLHEKNLECLLPADTYRDLSLRQSMNHRRMAGLIAQFREVVGLLDAAGVPFVVSKGFSLFPEFCPDIFARQQNDIDLLVAPGHLEWAGDALVTGGMKRSLESTAEEVVFVHPRYTKTKGRLRMYKGLSHSKIEVHSAVWKARYPVSVRLVNDPTAVTVWKELDGVRFKALAPAEAFFCQVLHAFQHFSSGWIRPSWLYEMSYCLESNKSNSEFSAKLSSLINSDQLKRIFDFMMSMTSSMFPLEAATWCPANPEVAAWLELCSEPYLYSGSEGTKLHTLVEGYFSAKPVDPSRAHFPLQKVLHPRSLYGIHDKTRLEAMRHLFDRGISHFAAGLQLRYFRHRWKKLLSHGYGCPDRLNA